MRKFNLDEEKNENRKIVCRGIIISSDSVEDFRRKFDIIRSKIKRWTLLWRLLSENNTFFIELHKTI